jgi:hypothetical protein
MIMSTDNINYGQIERRESLLLHIKFYYGNPRLLLSWHIITLYFNVGCLLNRTCYIYYKHGWNLLYNVLIIMLHVCSMNHGSELETLFCSNNNPVFFMWRLLSTTHVLRVKVSTNKGVIGFIMSLPPCCCQECIIFSRPDYLYCLHLRGRKYLSNKHVKYKYKCV